ncbi:MAG: DEAD/DEAH box helicase family protein [Clostridia bacterium]
MKIKFNPNLDYQLDAIDSVIDIFKGQEDCLSSFSIKSINNELQFKNYRSLGIANRLDNNISTLDNLRKIQLKNGLKQSKELEGLNFSIEMETGTGKTYVFLRTIFELNKNYGFSKFIIIVPSIAIKEGIFKSLEMTEDHFNNLYNTIPFGKSSYFIYDSKKLERVRDFAESKDIRIMIITKAAFDKEKNIFNRDRDTLFGYKPIELIRETNPILIIDEPQSVDNTERSREAINSLNPLFSLRYSATHINKYNLVYKLDAVDAHDKKIVKTIEVCSHKVENDFNNVYLKLISVDNKNIPIKAKIELYERSKSGDLKLKERKVKQGDDLSELSKNDMYEGFIVNNIYCVEGQEYVDFTSNNIVLSLGEIIGGDQSSDEIKRIQIRNTIEKHLEKESILNKKGIKVLSLFFIDKVKNYRYYDENGNVCKGKYANIFEEEYSNIIKEPRFNNLLYSADKNINVEEVHNGYFSQDKKGFKDTKGESQVDEDTYSLIMRDKEKLLDMNNKLRFIFSHSALKEGWDNPNVFQICTLNETHSEIKRRQEIGRGLRIAVNQEGERVYGEDVNILTVMANEAYDAFAKKLQTEIEQDTSVKFGYIETYSFSSISINESEYLGEEKSQKIFTYLEEKDYVDSNGKIKESLRKSINDNTFEVEEEFKKQEDQIKSVIHKLMNNRIEIKDANNREIIKLNNNIYLCDDFKELWDKIKYKTKYVLNFDSEHLILKCSEEIKNNLLVKKIKITQTEADLRIERGGINAQERINKSYLVQENQYSSIDIVGYLQEKLGLKRRDIAEILIKSERLKDFKKNPQDFTSKVHQIIKNTMNNFIVDGIKYEKLNCADNFYKQELFKENELQGYKNNLEKSLKSSHEYVVCDSNIEKNFAKDLEKNENVKVFSKLPNWFKIDTPLGTYNPDWAVLIEENKTEKLYFIVETKGDNSFIALRAKEGGKINCGRKHFEVIDKEIEFRVGDKLDEIF